MAQPRPQNTQSREPIKPLRIKEEQPGGLLGVLVWFRKRGGVFWWVFILFIMSIITSAVVGVPVARRMGHLDFRAAPDMSPMITVSNSTVQQGESVTIDIFAENLGASEAGAVTLDILLPDSLTATSVEPGTPACSHAGQLERFASLGVETVSGEPGGTIKCLFGTVRSGATKFVILRAAVANDASGAIPLAVWIMTQKTDNVAKQEELWDNNCSALTLFAGAGGEQPPPSDCSPLNLVGHAIELKTDGLPFSGGGVLTLVATYDNVADMWADSVKVELILPSELTAHDLKLRLDGRAQRGESGCSHSSQLEPLMKEGGVQVSSEGGGALTCPVLSRAGGVESKILLETKVGAVASGGAVTVELCAVNSANSADRRCRPFEFLAQ